MAFNCWELKLQIQRDEKQLIDFMNTIRQYTIYRDTYAFVVYTDFEVKNFHTIVEAQAQYDLWRDFQPTLHPIETTQQYYNPLIAELARGIEKLKLQIEDEKQQYIDNNCGQPPPDNPPSDGRIISGCFILTAIGNQPLIDEARAWRDTRPLYFKPLILLYYILSPLPAHALAMSKRIKSFLKPIIERIVGLIVS